MNAPHGFARGLFTAYEEAFPYPSLRRQWSDLTPRERAQWIKVGQLAACMMRAAVVAELREAHPEDLLMRQLGNMFAQLIEGR